jgi:transmembrane sensor
MEGADESPSEAAGRWYARLRAPDCSEQDRAEFAAWRAKAPAHAEAYAAAERLNDALAKLAMADARLKAMVDQAASAGGTLPDEAEEAPAGKPPPLRITAAPTLGARRRIGRNFVRAASFVTAVGSLLAVLASGGSKSAAAESRCAGFDVVRAPSADDDVNRR